MPTTAMARTVERYERLGSTVCAPGAPSVVEAAIAIAAGAELHLARQSDHEPARTASSVYVSLENADAMSADGPTRSPDRRK